MAMPVSASSVPLCIGGISARFSKCGSASRSPPSWSFETAALHSVVSNHSESRSETKKRTSNTHLTASEKMRDILRPYLRVPLQYSWEILHTHRASISHLGYATTVSRSPNACIRRNRDSPHSITLCGYHARLHCLALTGWWWEERIPVLSCF
ncbi:hypothetical protein M427DRAFT_147698 [Gonapodya prolifera JEL478]|uniref:Uncharacterized protein n=1 Tax=Gonapodya prolifera (strain JEL478) TaxID=1344416 RepID=A0A139A5I7_GONPJ|nr:hypothetical protein M427DRAFT_147698 [Gonapodya prolifera JEL478]|eukprot:KXS11663.1 hypothetical protein M427DRAFT_147698 [Gonapodya prolifera JEL478]